MKQNIKNQCLTITTLGPLGSLRFSPLLATLFAIPLVYGVSLLDSYLPAITNLILGTLFIAIIIVSHIALKEQEIPSSPALLLGKMFLFTVSFLSIPLSLKIITVGFILFHMITTLLPVFVHQTWGLRLQSLPDILGLLITDSIAALLINVMFRFIFWVAQ